VVRTLATGGFVAVVPVVAGLSVQRYRLYDIDHILSRASAYMLTSIALIAVFIAVTAGVGQLFAVFVDDSTLAAIVATALTVSIALPVLRWSQDVVDRRFDRRRHEAHRLVREHLTAAHPPRSLEETLAAALHAPELTVAYWLPEQNRWATAEGQEADLRPGDIEVSRADAPVARLRLGVDHPDVRLARDLATEAVSELDNIRLRAELAAQLDEVRRSRERIVLAQTAERRRIERNLHDGAQQRLLALAMRFRAGQLREEARPERALLDLAVDEITAAIQDLRDLANGLHPTVLADGGLGAALDDLAGRSPLCVRIDATEGRLPPPIEEALWFVACEALANTVKHSRAERVDIAFRIDDGVATLRCIDDGSGTADAARGGGLRGIADRIEAIGGRLHIASAAGHGTTIEAVVPCGS
jgi:signal transduction histidine kinase